MGFICRLFRKKKKQPIKNIVATSSFTLTKEETDFITEVQKYVLEQTGTHVFYDGWAQSIANERTDFWSKNDYDSSDNLHDKFLGYIQPYKDSSFTHITNVAELANYGYKNDLRAFIKSEKHNKELTSGKYDGIGASLVGKYCCLILTS